MAGEQFRPIDKPYFKQYQDRLKRAAEPIPIDKTTRLAKRRTGAKRKHHPRD